MGETTVQVFEEANKTTQSKSHLWVQRGGRRDARLILLVCGPSGGQYLQTDDEVTAR